MIESSADLWHGLYVLSFFILGLSVTVRASAFPPCAFRNRLLALGAFGLIQAVSSWIGHRYSLSDGPPFYFEDLIYVPRSLALYYFAFGWDKQYPMRAHAIVVASACAVVATSLVITDPEFMDILTRYAIAIPASICAASAFVRDKAFRSRSITSDIMRWLVAGGFMAYAALQMFSDPGNYPISSALNALTFEEALGFSPRLPRSLAILTIAVGTVLLLNHFDSVMQMQTQRTLRHIDAKLQKALEITGLGSWEWYVKDDTANWSDKMYQILGLTAAQSEAKYLTFMECVHPEDRSVLEAAVEATLRTQAPYKMVHRIITGDGRVRFVEGRAEVELDASGNVYKMSGSLQDITELEEARAELNDRERKLSRILEVSPEAIIICNQKGHVIVFSEGASEIFGYSSEEILGRSMDMLMPERFRRAHHKHVRGFASGQSNAEKMGERTEITGLRKNGEEFPARATISKMETADGLMFTVCLRDVTHSKVVREELIAAKTEAEAASAAKSNFIANMSHELRTPLNAIIGFSDIARSEAFGPHSNPQYREYAEDIYRSGRHLLEIVDDLLTVSQLDAKKLQLQDETAIDTEEWLEECLKWVQESADKSRVVLRKHTHPDIPNLWANKRLLTQVMLNLLSNAIKFAPEGGVVEISGSKTQEGSVRLSVRDTGIGMTPDQIARIGEPFLQFEGAHARKFSGTGLGLSIAKPLVEMHGSTLKVESKPNIGTEFYFELPRERSMQRLSTNVLIASA